MTGGCACRVLALVILTATPAFAQLNGENVPGDNGVRSGSQAAPGAYVGVLYYRYDTDTIRNRNGTRLVFDATQPLREVGQALRVGTERDPVAQGRELFCPGGAAHGQQHQADHDQTRRHAPVRPTRALTSPQHDSRHHDSARHEV